MVKQRLLDDELLAIRTSGTHLAETWSFFTKTSSFTGDHWHGAGTRDLDCLSQRRLVFMARTDALDGKTLELQFEWVLPGTDIHHDSADKMHEHSSDALVG